MLSYVFKVLQSQGYAHLMTEEFEHIEDLFAAILAKGMSQQVKRGLVKNYTQKIDVLATPKGKINLTTSIKKQTQRQNKLVCQYDEFSENIILNQILKATSLKLLKSKEVTLEQKKHLRRVLCYFQHIKEINIRQIKWTHIQYDRNNAHYKMLINICQMVVEHLLFTEQIGNTKLPKYMDDQKMHQLYERFVREYYRYHYPQLKVSAANISWHLDDEMSVYLPTMKTDIMIEYQDKVVIIDTKYYGRSMQSHGMYGTQTLHSANMYQIYTYVKNKDTQHTGKVSGVILYAQTDEAVTPNQTYLIDGNRISVKCLDLNSEFENIKRQLNEILINERIVEGSSI